MAVQEIDVIVVGAGVAGLYALHRMREAGLSVQCIDAAPDIGGTWHWNCYPGARLDSPSYTYQYWFSDEVLNEWEWSERFPAQPEIKRYLKFVADKFNLHPDITLDTRIKSAIWNAEQARWLLTSESGEQWSTRFVISCVGTLSAPNSCGLGSPRVGIDLFATVTTLVISAFFLTLRFLINVHVANHHWRSTG